MKRSEHKYAYNSIKLSSRSRIEDNTYIVQESNSHRPEEIVKVRNSDLMNTIASVNKLDNAKKIII